MDSTKITVWHDCDPGLDDTFAIIYAAHSPSINLLGVSTSPGNTSLKNTTQNALDILYNIGRSDIPVYQGSNILIKGQMKLAEHMHGSNGLGGIELPKSPKKSIKEKSFEKIYHRIVEHPGKVSWVNTGSLTNLCILLLAYPDLADKFDKIVMMGGAMGKGNITPAAEFNVFFDPHAFQQVLRLKKKVPLVMIPLQVTHQNMATDQIIQHFSTNKNIPFSRAIHDMLIQFKAMYYKAYKFSNPPIHDPLTVFYLLHPEEIQTKKAMIEVDTDKYSYGRTNVWFQSLRYPDIAKQSVDLVAVDLKNDKTKFWDEMLKIFQLIFSEKIQGLISNE